MTMAHDDQTRDPDERGNKFSRADAFSLSSFGSNSSEEGSLVTDGEDEEDKSGHVNLVMSELLNQPPPSSVNITNSSDVQIGPSLHYNGPVTINQFLNLQQQGALGAEDTPLPLDGTGKGVLTGVASSGIGGSAEASKRSGGDGAGGRGALWWRRPKVLAAAGAFVVFVAGAATAMALLWPSSRVGSGTSTAITSSRDATASQRNYVIPTVPPPNPELVLKNGQRIVPRSLWSSGVPPNFRIPLHHPIPYVVVGHTAGFACKGEEECFVQLRAYRDEHYSKWKQPDISYNFLIDVEGNIYEGRGWGATNNYDREWVLRCNLAVTFMGNFVHHNATEAMARSLQLLLELGVSLGKLDSEYRLLAHNQVASTLSPGRNVLALIESWPHRCLELCGVGVQCIRANSTEVSTTASSTNESGESLKRN
ncbi:peptidoglycan-recognition protein LA-like isoform X1 [Schistocerca cancellata]|uniref:peptidoglycan-recognition protein LA-like isoform X1 n=1 Tax=Schistocerca cancellata TaxID=274614 RepID=UPI0021177F93|nr:peptidoglycan-recognition protein LA-like isoform X1 [Schistocerca cancellata]